MATKAPIDTQKVLEDMIRSLKADLSRTSDFEQRRDIEAQMLKAIGLLEKTAASRKARSAFNLR